MCRKGYGVKMSSAFIIQKLPDVLVWPKTVENFRKRFYFPNLTDFFIFIAYKLNAYHQIRRHYGYRQYRQYHFLSLWNTSFWLGWTIEATVYRFMLTATDVFMKYLFAVPLTKSSWNTCSLSLWQMSEQTFPRELTSMFSWPSYLPKTTLSDLGTSLVSELLHESTKLL